LGWLVDLLEELELEPHLVHPSRCKAIASASCRNDKVDAATLAQLLRADLLPEAWIAPQATRDLRAVLRHRASLVRLSTSCKNRIHAVLADRGIPDHASLWTGPGRAWLADLELPATHAGSSRTAVGCWTPWPPRSPGRNRRSPGWPNPTHGSRRSWSCPASAG
jgi:transposase